MIQSGQVKGISEKLADFEQRMTKIENKLSELDRVIVSKPQLFGQSQQPSGHITGTYKPVGAEFTMINFEEYKRENDVWYSPHFYTHPNGYKMCLGVYANGISSGQGTHLSLGVSLMQGEFDDQLKWPFQGDISVRLVNQEDDRDHTIITLDFGNAPSECCERVLTKKRNKNVYGFHKVLLHAELQPKYLKNNCIKLCIKNIDLF
jgi:TNF receptor-associated factor 4